MDAAATPAPPDLLAVLPTPQRNYAPVILIGLSVTVLLLGGFIAFYLLYYQEVTEKALAAEAEALYRQGNFAAAAKAYRQLADDYPGSREAETYAFFADLAGMQAVARAVTNRQSYAEALQRWQEFVAAWRGSPLVKPQSGYGHDIFDAGKKICEDMIGFGEDRLAAYREDRRGQSPAIAEIEAAIRSGRELLQALEPFRAPDDPPLENLRQQWERLEQALRQERERQEVLAKVQAGLQSVSDAAIAAAEQDLAAAGLLNDAEAQQMLAAARARLREMIRYEADLAAAQEWPAATVRTVAAAIPVGETAKAAEVAAPPAIFPVLARGVLYALEEQSGTLLWALPVGPEATFPPTVARLELEDGPAEVAIVAVQARSRWGVAAVVLRSGLVRWFQPLPAPPTAPAAVLGSRAYLAVQDELGTIYEIDLIDGSRRGRLRVGQPVSHLVPDAEQRRIYAVADARRIFVLDAGSGLNPDSPLPLRCVQVLASGHPPGTLPSPPLLLPTADKGERRLLLCQADGPRSTRLRLFPVPPAAAAPPDAVPPETILSPLVEHTVEGWVRFPPTEDGERLYVTADSGELSIFGLSPPGSPEPPLFRIAVTRRPPGESGPDGAFWPQAAAAAPVPTEEGSCWLLSRQQLHKYRLGMHAQRGWELGRVGNGHLLGVPLAPPIVHAARQSICWIVRAADGHACQAVLLSARSGTILWRRQLGIVAAAAPIIQDDQAYLIGQEGAILRLPAAALGQNVPILLASPEMVVAAPPLQSQGTTAIAQAATRIAAVTPVERIERDKRQLHFVIRIVEQGRLVHDGTVPAPAALAGPVALMGQYLLLPLADGVVYRHIPGKGLTQPDRLEPGPTWWIDRRRAATASLQTLDPSSFVTHDGSRLLKRWSWPAQDRWKPSGEWELREPPAGEPVPLPAADNAPLRFVIADDSGTLWLYGPDRTPLRRWRAVGLPAARPDAPPTVWTGPRGQPAIAAVVPQQFVLALDPQQDHPLWTIRCGDDPLQVLVAPPQPAGNGLLLTDRGGRLLLLRPDGHIAATVPLEGIAGFPVVPAVRLADHLLVPLSNGTVAVAAAPPSPDKPNKQDQADKQDKTAN